ncbi:polymorphic toxin type 37 domain-containing protein, partial [Fastidiosibacter lacustris]|uniref:polymorphic toxin type 37 domain-containing protein n=1 Tax=Fastidiosibacter lacustris TaxID=2056695 RepID=UPI00195EEA1C
KHKLAHYAGLIAANVLGGIPKAGLSATVRGGKAMAKVALPRVVKESGAVPKGKGLANPFKDKSANEIDQMFRDKGFNPRGLDPLNGKGGYVNPKTDRSYHIDPGGKYKKGTEYPHVDVNRANGSKLPKKKYPLGDVLNDN